MSRTQGWQQVRFDEVIEAWMSAGGVQPIDKSALTFQVPTEPKERYQTFVEQSYLFIRFIPMCDWFRVRFDREDDVLALRLIAEESWEHALAGDARELGARTELSRLPTSHARRADTLSGRSDLGCLIDDRVVLFGHESNGPLTILDGNHRLLALAHRLVSGRERLTPFHAFVGLSQGPCRWHGDPVEWNERPGLAPGERRFILNVW